MPRNLSQTAAELGRHGARKRWGPPRHLDLRDLTSEQRDIVLALVEAKRSELKALGDE